MKRIFSSKKHDQLYIKGFTLVELLATIAILGIISGIIVYVSINVINSAKNKSYDVTISNIENVAMEYAIENQNNILWKYAGIDGSEQYYCVNVQDLIDTGYFKSDVLDSYIGKDLLVKSDDYVYLEMNSLTKTITKNKLLLSDDGEYISLCNDASTINSYYFDLNWILDGSNFNSSQVLAGVKIGGVDKGYVSSYFSYLPNETSWEIYGIKLNGTSISYSANGIVMTENINHDIRINTLSVSANSSSYGSVSSSSLYVLENETYTTSDNILILGDGRRITATASNIIGYTTTFSNWSSNSGTISNATNIIANFDRTIDTYTVSYDANGGSGAPDSQTKNYKETLTLSNTIPIKEGYTFLGWSTSKTATSATYGAGGSYTANVSTTLYAVWSANSYAISYTLNGGTLGTNAPTSGTYGNVVTISNPTKTVTVIGNANGTGATVGSNTSKAQTFAGWTASNLNTSTAYYGTSSSLVTTSWSNSARKVTAQYFKNLASSGNTVTLTANWTAVSFNLPTVTKTGYTCTWNTASNGSGTSYASGASYTPSTTASSSVTLYAVCTSGSYNISYTLNGGTSGTYAPTSGTYGSVVTISNPTKTVTVIGNANGTGATVGSNTSKAQTFAGWTSTTVGSNAKTGISASPSTAWSGSSTKNTYFRNLRESGTVTMVANWTAVSFNLPTVTKTGYTCTWNTASNGSGTSYASGASYTPSITGSSSVTLYAVCTSGSYNISYTLNGGTSGTYAPTSGTYGSVVTISNPTKTVTVIGNANGTGATVGSNTSKAQTFAGWTSATVGSNAKTGTSASPSTAWSGSSTKNIYFRNLRESGTVTMVANWTAVSFNLPTVTKTGYTCTWNTASNGSGTSYASGASYTPSITGSSSVTLYAVCTSGSYNISYTLNGGTSGTYAPKSGTYGSVVTISNPTKTVTVTGNANNTGVSFTNQTGTAQTFAGWTSTTLGSNAKTGISASPSTAWSGSSTKNTYFRNLRESGTVTMVANWTAVGVKLPTFTNPIGKICYWYSAPSGGTKYGASGATYSPSAIVGSSITAYLQCSNNIYIINYSMNSGTNYSGAPISYLYGTGATISGTPIRSGYTFNGWYYESTTKFSQTIGTTTTGDKTMEAKWCQNCASVTNGSCTLNASTAGACTYTTSCNTGYTISNNGKYNPTCTANTYTIGYKLNGGTSGTYAPTSGTYGSVVTISNPTKTVTVIGNANGTGATVGSNTSKAQTFSGWTSTTVGSNAKTGTSATPSTVWSGSSTKNTYFRNLRESGTVTMVANWTAVSFNLPTVTKAGYTCTWNTASNGSGTSYASGASYTPSTTASSSVTLYAVCTANTYTVSYDANGGSGAPSSQRKIYGVTLTLSSTVPTREGYTFLGWSTSRTATSATYKAGENYTVNANLTLYAVWKFTATVPLFSYTGNYEIVDDDNNVISSPSTWSGNWKIKFLTSGTLTISTLNGAKNGIDIFIVGGGGYGGSGSRYIASNSRGGGGGGGGAAVKVSGFKATTTSYSITIGSGAPDLTTNATASSFGSYSAAAAGSRPVTPSWDGNGGMKVPVGCGGLSTATVSNLTPTCTVVETVDCTSCSDGSNKVESRSGGQGNGWLYNNAGPQFTSTGTYNHQYMGNYEFFESGNLLYGAGGGSGGSGASINMYEDGNTGRTGGNATGAGAGGLGCYNNGSVHTGTAGSAAIANTGSGGGGGGGNCGSGSTNCTSTSATAGGAGGSGIVIIRNAR